MENEVARLSKDFELGVLNKVGHANFCARCLNGLPATMSEADSSRVAIGFYCLGALDILGILDTKVKDEDRDSWRAWIWAQQVRRPGHKRSANTGLESNQERLTAGPEEGHIGGFRPGPFMHVEIDEPDADAQASRSVAAEADPPHLIMTYTALLALAILRDDFTQLDRQGLVNLLRAAQIPDGSFSAFPGQGEADLRLVYTAFAISAMLDDWSGVDVPRAIQFVKRCISYEGGFGQVPGNEAQGGPTYCALATLALAPAAYRAEATLSARDRKRLERWLVRQQQPRRVYLQEYEVDDDEDNLIGNDNGNETTTATANRREKKTETEIIEEGGGFAGRTEKDGDACYSFWCGAALRILRSGAVSGGPHSGSPLSDNTLSVDRRPDLDEKSEERRREDEDTDFVDRLTHARFLSRCQFRLGGLAKAPGAHPDPYHTYLALAALALYPPYSSSEKEQDVKRHKERESWRLAKLDPLINATAETASWAREKISGKTSAS